MLRSLTRPPSSKVTMRSAASCPFLRMFWWIVVSRGLVPEDFGSFSKQQLKWARGVFEVAFVEIPRLLGRLKFWQKLSYLTIGTYYLVGVTAFLFTLLPFLFFFTGALPATMSFTEFLIRGSFVALFGIAIYLYVQRYMCHPGSEKGFHWRGMILKYSSWPVFFLGFLLGVVNAEIPYIPTAKKAVTGSMTPFARPLIIQILLFTVVFLFVFLRRRFFLPEGELVFTAEKVWGMMGFAFVAVLSAAGGVFAAREAKRMKPEEPWSRIDLRQINKPTDD